MKKGFTLIELLAVIVILAIIAVIAVPIVLDIIKDTKESAVLTSASLYLNGVEISVLNRKLTDEAFKIQDGTYTIMEDGNICLGVLNEKCDGDILKIEADGEIPIIGSINFKEEKVKIANLEYKDGNVILNAKGKLVLGEFLSNYIKKLYNPNKTATVNGIEYDLDATNFLMNDRLGSNDAGKTEGNIRYYGASPNNYIDIGDRDSEGNIILWRIIGLFKNVEVTDERGNVIKTEDLVKIIRADELTSGSVNKFSWDYTSTGAYDDNWNDSTLQIMLNDEVNGYYGSGITSYYNNSTTAITLDFKSTGLSSEAHSKIERVKWDISESPNPTGFLETIYKAEKAGTKSWAGKIALMNVSDYGYAADLSSCNQILTDYNHSTCKSTNWMYDSRNTQSTLNTYSSSSYAVFHVRPTGKVSRSTSTYETLSVRPVLYLKSDVSVGEEKETSGGLKYFAVE